MSDISIDRYDPQYSPPSSGKPVTGKADYMLRIVAPDLAAFSDLMMKGLLSITGVAQVMKNIAPAKMKKSHELPLDHMARPRPQKRRVTYTG